MLVPRYDFFLGTLAPALRASDKPMAIACLRLVTFLPDRPLLSVPRLRSCIAFSTFLLADFPYFRAIAASSSRVGQHGDSSVREIVLHATCRPRRGISFPPNVLSH